MGAASRCSRHVVPVSGGVIVVPGGGQLARSALASQSSSRFRRAASAGGSTPFLVSPFCPPIPRFICLGQLLAFRQDWLVCAVRQQLPQITAAGLKNGPLKQRRLTESASLYLPRSESNPSQGPIGGLAPAACRAHLHSCVGKASRGSRCRHPPAPAAAKILARMGTRDKMADLCEKGNKEGTAA